MQIRRSLWITLAYSNASTVGMFAVTLVLARILTPRDIGIYTLCVTAINFASVLRDLGTGPYLISKGEVTAQDTGAVLGLTLTSSWIIAGGLWLGRDLLAHWFNEPQMADVLAVMLIGFLLIPLAGLMNALLMRNLSAWRSAFVTIGSNVIYAVVVLTLASHGFGAMATAWANAANVLTNVLLFILVMPKGFRLRPLFSGWGPPIRYGSGVLVTNLAQVAHQSLPDIAIGRSLGAHEVGLFSRALGTVGLFQQVVGPTLTYNALPIIARTHHEDAKGVAELMIKSALLLTALAWPVYAWFAFHPAAIIELLCGPQWVAAADLVPWLCVAAAIRTPFLVVSPALQAVGKNFHNARVQVINLLLRVLMLVAFGLNNLQHLVIALCLADSISVLPLAWEARQHLGLSLSGLFTRLRSSLIVAAACSLVALGVHALLSGSPMLPIFKVALSGSAIGLAWLLSIVLVRHPVADELRRLLSRSQNTGH